MCAESKNKGLDIKYTKDGKKVVVIGYLNQNERIVQEIYVTKNGDEIPAGENFVVKTLLDEPMKTWQEQKLENLQATYESDRKKWDEKIDALVREKDLAYKALKARVKWLREVAKQPHPEALKRIISTLADFLSPAEKWVLVCDSCKWQLEKFNEEGICIIDGLNYSYGKPRYDRMKLISLFGMSDGNFEWCINRWSDGSGDEMPVLFFKTKEAALSSLQKRLDNIETYNKYTIENANKFGLKLNSEKLTKYYERKREVILSDIDSFKKQITEREQELENIKIIKL